MHTEPGDCSGVPGYMCTIGADMMQLYYWPVTREDYDVCNKTGITATNNYPTTAVVGSLTITSPFVALSMPAISAYDFCGVLGTVMKNVVVTLPASQLSSGNGAGMHAVTNIQPFDYGHLPPNRVPLSAWLSQPICNYRSRWLQPGNLSGSAWTSAFASSYPECGTIWEADYVPQLAAPTEIPELQPEWSSCTAIFGLYDPPKALQPVASMAGPTTSLSAITSPAAAPLQSSTIAPQTSNAAVKSSSDPTAASQVVPKPETQPISAADPAMPQVATAPPTSTPQGPGDLVASSLEPSTLDSANVVVSGPSSSSQGIADIIASVIGLIATSTTPMATTPTSDEEFSPEANLSPAGAIDSSPYLHAVAAGGHSAAVADPNGRASSMDPPGLSIIATVGVSKTAEPHSGQGVGIAGSDATALIGAPGMTLGDPDATTTTANNVLPAATILGLDGQAVTILQQGPSLLVQQGASVETLAPGSQAMVDGNTIVAPEKGGKPVLDGAAIALTSDTSDATPATASLSEAYMTGVGGERMTIVQSGGLLLVEGKSTTVTLAPESQTAVDGRIISVPHQGADPMVDGAVMTLSGVDPSASTQDEAAATGIDGERISVLQSRSLLLVEDTSSTVTLAAGASVVMDGQTIEAPRTDTGAILDGTSIALTAAPNAATPIHPGQVMGLRTTGTDGHAITILQSGAGVIIEDGSSSTYVAPGSQAVFDGEIVSASAVTGVVVIDGSTAKLETMTAGGGASATTGATITATAEGSGATVIPRLLQAVMPIPLHYMLSRLYM